MRITEVAKSTGATPDQVRYLEKKKYIRSRWKRLKTRRVRDYSATEVHKIEHIIKYLDQGFKYDIAYQKAMEELAQPRLV
jgi:DNA-binding transcriptional MerR regulator